MAIFIIDKHKNEKFGRLQDKKVYTCIECTPAPFITDMDGLAVVNNGDGWRLYSYDPDNIEVNHLLDWGEEQYIWAMFFRRSQQMLNTWRKGYTEYSEAQNEGANREQEI